MKTDYKTCNVCKQQALEWEVNFNDIMQVCKNCQARIFRGILISENTRKMIYDGKLEKRGSLNYKSIRSRRLLRYLREHKS
jgi:hypothetical protein